MGQATFCPMVVELPEIIEEVQPRQGTVTDTALPPVGHPYVKAEECWCGDT